MANAASEQPVILNGDLNLTIIEVRDLPNMGVFSEHLRPLFSSDRTNPYVNVVVPHATVARTSVIENANNPRWNEHFFIPLAHLVVNLEFKVKDKLAFGAQLIGTAKIPAEMLAGGELISDWFPVIGSSGKPPKPGTALRIEMRFTPCEKNKLYKHGIAGDPEQMGVRNTYFPLWKGNSVRLYQDAHVPDGLLPEIELDGGKIFQHEKCWEDICQAIAEARHTIYITGWSIFHKIKLVREPTRELPRGGDLMLGDLLKYKSEEGVRVLLLVWDDKTSHDKLLIKTKGVMQTHDEETKKFFEDSSVICVLAPRYASGKHRFIKQLIVGLIFTHHQKCVLVDTQASGNNRKITAFVGGLDLCDGRYDTPQHRLYQDLNTVFNGDFHNPTFPAGTKAPREPWHDLHSKIDGPAAYDVLKNFEQRFNMHPQKDSTYSDTVIPDDDRKLWVSKDDESWHVQILRSIDNRSVKGFPRDVELAKDQNLICAKNLVIDKSIQNGYIQAIRSAQHFIYIENQYFVGASYGWPDYKNAGANNLIPMELALKIASKIKANERFAVYIVIPMWPEGNPKSKVVQEILYWQSQTMQMMYDVVARELKSMQRSELPQDYLNFYCLGNREEYSEDVSGADAGKVSDSQKFRRFMIYVHAKGMIVDDEYVVVGSPNINERSMAGTKDTEIAMGSYQPHYTWAKMKKHPRGQVYGYRMSLWAEHLGLGQVETAFEEPESLDCVRMVNKIADDNWGRFTAEEFKTLQGHLLKYPLQVDDDGKVSPLPGYEKFPDVGGKVIGAHSTTLPDKLTT